jgi:hypothetical protein
MKNGDNSKVQRRHIKTAYFTVGFIYPVLSLMAWLMCINSIYWFCSTLCLYSHTKDWRTWSPQTFHKRSVHNNLPILHLLDWLYNLLLITLNYINKLIWSEFVHTAYIRYSCIQIIIWKHYNICRQFRLFSCLHFSCKYQYFLLEHNRIRYQRLSSVYSLLFKFKGFVTL